MLAYADGKEVECLNDNYKWVECKDPAFNWTYTAGGYRIKPTPTYRPFANAEECWEEMKKHQPFGWVRSKNNNDIYCLSAVEDCGIITYIAVWEYALAENRITFADGTPFGKLTEEG